MKQLIIFSEYVQNKRNVKERLTSILDHFVNVNALDEKGVPTIKSQNLTIDSYKHEDDFGGDNFDEMVYVAIQKRLTSPQESRTRSLPKSRWSEWSTRLSTESTRIRQ